MPGLAGQAGSSSAVERLQIGVREAASNRLGKDHCHCRLQSRSLRAVHVLHAPNPGDRVRHIHEPVAVVGVEIGDTHSRPPAGQRLIDTHIPTGGLLGPQVVIGQHPPGGVAVDVFIGRRAESGANRGMELGASAGQPRGARAPSPGRAEGGKVVVAHARVDGGILGRMHRRGEVAGAVIGRGGRAVAAVVVSFERGACYDFGTLEIEPGVLPVHDVTTIADLGRITAGIGVPALMLTGGQARGEFLVRAPLGVDGREVIVGRHVRIAIDVLLAVALLAAQRGADQQCLSRSALEAGRVAPGIESVVRMGVVGMEAAERSTVPEIRGAALERGGGA